MRAYKFRIYPTKAQDAQMRQHLWIAKGLWNDLLEHTKTMYRDYGYFPSRNTLQLMVKNAGMYSQTQQEIAHRINDATKRFLRLKKEGKKVGFPRFKSFDRMKSLHYPQSGFSLDKKLKVTPFGSIKIVQHRVVEGRIKTMSLKRESSGKWFAVFTVEEPETTIRPNKGTKIGVDVGLKSFATLSDGSKIPNPRHYNKCEEKLAKVQRRMSRKKRRSRNRLKAKIVVAKTHEKIRNVRMDFLHKESRKLVENHSLLALEKLNVKGMVEEGLGKSINDAGWSAFANMLQYKASSAGCEVVFVDAANTTKTCHRCGNVQDMPLSKRTYHCPQCGMVEDRDLNASKNILIRATLGHSGSNALGDGANVRCR